MPSTSQKRGAPGRTRTTAGKRSQLATIRLDDRTKAALEAAAEKNGSTFSSEAAERLMRSVSFSEQLRPDFDHEEDRALSSLLVMLHRRLRQYTGASWRDDAYTCGAFTAGLAVLAQALPGMLGLADGHAAIPDRLREIYRNSPRALLNEGADPAAATPPTAKELGRGLMVGLLDLLPAYGIPAPGVRHATGYIREYWELPQVFHDLRLGRKGSSGGGAP